MNKLTSIFMTGISASLLLGCNSRSPDAVVDKNTVSHNNNEEQLATLYQNAANLTEAYKSFYFMEEKLHSKRPQKIKEAEWKEIQSVWKLGEEAAGGQLANTALTVYDQVNQINALSRKASKVNKTKLPIVSLATLIDKAKKDGKAAAKIEAQASLKTLGY